MKKIQLIGLGVLATILVGLGIYALIHLQSRSSDSQDTLAVIQTPESTQSGASIARAMSLEKQKQLTQIGEIYEVQANEHLGLIQSSFQKYKADFTLTDAQKIADILLSNPNEIDFEKLVKDATGITLLKNDIKTLLSSYVNLSEEKQLKQERLELLRASHEEEILADTTALLELGIRSAIESSSASGQIQNSEKLVGDILTELTKTQNIFDTKKYTTQKSQVQLLENQVQKRLSETTLSKPLQESLQKDITQNILKLEILIPENPKTGFFWKLLPSLAHVSVWDFFVGNQVSANAELSTERQILLLKTQAAINKLLQKNIDTEIAYNAGTLSAVAYNDTINANLVAIEELLIFQESLQLDDAVLSLGTIQKYDLGSYVDDSQALSTLTPIAYIQEKNGHAMLQNLNGSIKLAQDAMLLYPGYTIETLENSSLTLVFIDESILRLEPQTKVSLKNSSENLAVEVNSGNIWARVLKPLLSGEVFTIDTGNVSLAVAGTSLYVSASGATEQVSIVDSYTPDASPSVTLTQKSNGQQTPLSAEKKVEITGSSSLNIQNQSTVSLLQSQGKISRYIAEDLSYLSLTLDDRKRGFYNSPLPVQNNGQNFLGKLEGELQVSIPDSSERSYIIQNSEIAGQAVNTGSIYHLLKKDELITEIKNSSTANKAQKISAVQNADFKNIQANTGSGNVRDLEALFDYEITKDILDANTSNITALFDDFNTTERKENAKRLSKARDRLLLNSGSSVVSRSITLPTVLSEGITVSWTSSIPKIVSPTGLVQNPERDTNIILTATLKLGQQTLSKDFGLVVIQRQLSEQEKLEVAESILDTYINSTSGKRFINSLLTYSGSSIIVPDFSQNGYIIPQITWTGSIYINSDGSTHRPNFSQVNTSSGYLDNIEVSAILTHPTENGITLRKSYTVSILRQTETADEAKAAFLASLNEKNTEYQNTSTSSGKLLKSSLSLSGLNNFQSAEPNCPGNSTTGANTLPFLSYSGNDKKLKITNANSQSEKNCDVNFTLKTRSSTGEYIEAPTTSYTHTFIIPRGTMIAQEYYQLVAAAEYNESGEYKLRDKNNTIIENSISPTGISGISGNTTDFSLNTYQDNQKTVINKSFSLVQVGTETGIFIDNQKTTTNTKTIDFLSYNLSSLQLGDNWAIEMSVRGEDLKRDDRKPDNSKINYGLLSIPNQLYILNRDSSFEKNDSSGALKYNKTINDGYQSIIITKNKLYFNNNNNILLNNIILGNELLIGSNKDKLQQWNGIINNLKIYKKE